METIKWDPLESVSKVSEEILTASKKREIRNILKSYVGIYDPFCELLQNAMDAVDTREKLFNMSAYKKKILIIIDLDENSLIVVDNGIGFDENEFKAFISPNVSFKSKGKSRGNKGVGSTYVAYGFDYVKMATKTPNYSATAVMKNGRTWVDDEENAIKRPFVEVMDIEDESLKEIDRGSAFKIKFGGENTRPKDLSWFKATTSEQWKYILLLKTPLGHIFDDYNNSKIFFDIQVRDKNGQVTNLFDEIAQYIYPHKEISASLDLKIVLDYQKKLIEKGADPANLPNKFRQLNGLYSFFSTDDLLRVFNWDSDKNTETYIRKHSIQAYGYFCYTTAIWDEFSNTIAKLRKGTRILRGGLQLATDHMPQGELITIPLTSNIGYQNQNHIIIHFKDADPDLGRKGFQPELQQVAEKISVSIVNKFKRWRKLLKKDTGTVPGIIDEGKLHDWIKEQENYEQENPLMLTNKNFFLPVNEISITSRPKCEQDVVVLFNQLIAGGVIRGLKLMASSTNLQYDGLYRFFIQEPLENHIFNKQVNPLGVEKMVTNKEYISKPYVLEYKFTLDALINEFKNQEKHESDISLVIAWEIGNQWKDIYQVTSLLDINNTHLRPFHGITHIFVDELSGDTKFYAIILSELIDYLNDVDSVQRYQTEKYEDII